MAKISAKRMQVDKANATMVGLVAAAAFLVIFSLVASKALLSQRGYQSRVISKKKEALAQLQANNQAASQLVESYKAFVSGSTNIIGGSVTGTGDRDGDNAKIVLDALPSKYDFPALATSLEKIINSKNYKLELISGTDDELNQSAAGDSSQAVEMPFELTVSGNFDTAQGLLELFQRSIRPIRIVKIDFTAKENIVETHVTGLSYYLPQKTVKIEEQVIQ